ncbi:MAG TPA: ATP-binding cassette domain-containing protein [Candidatus Saccharimonadia bacterium]|jgi:NitT/TauT family transport system ATP-binding protein|nr:ATP-binding cassette domain-containing protein [Candidatus Saccharimonadia bacterium]
MKAAAITAKNLSKHFDASGASLEVLRGVELQVAAGEFVCLLGPSGSGKSTLLHCLAGLDEPSSGTVTVGGRTGQELLGASGYAMQKPLLLPWRTVRDNVMLGPVLAGRTRASAAHAADELLGQFGLAAFADQYPGVLSGGMAQKTALLRAVLYNYD